MAIYRRFRVQQKYVNGKPTEEYRLGVEVDSTDYNSLEECNRGSDCTELEYRWVDMESADDYICDGTNKYKKQRKQQKCITEEAWTNVYPYEYRAGDLIEHDSVDCGYDPTYHRIFSSIQGNGSIGYIKSQYSIMEKASITAYPSVGYSFIKWLYGSNTNYGNTTTNSVLTLFMSQDWYIKAVFTEPDYFKVYTYGDGNGKINVIPSKESYLSTDVVILTAEPKNGYYLSYYQYGSTIAFGSTATTNTLILSTTHDLYISAAFSTEGVAPRKNGLYYLYQDGTESWYDWTSNTLSEADNNGKSASIIIDYDNVITTMPSYAFSQAMNYKKLVLISFNNLTSPGDHTFVYRSDLRVVNMENIESIPMSMFMACYNLETVNMPKLKYTDRDAFANCSKLYSINMSNIVSLGSFTFKSCYALTEAYLPNLTQISQGAFLCCSRLSQVYIPKITTIASQAFEQCPLSSFDFTKISEIIGIWAFRETLLKSVYAPLLISLGSATFTNCHQLESIDLPQVSSLDWNTFGLCVNLRTINMPKLTYIGSCVFQDCRYGLKSIYFPNVSYLGNDAFLQCENLLSVSLPKITAIYNNTFASCYKLEYINTPLVSYIGSWAFWHCSQLKTVSFPVVEKIWYHAFSSCSNLTTVYFDKITSVISTSGAIFDGCTNLKSIYIPSSLVDAFKADSGWKSLATKFIGV